MKTGDVIGRPCLPLPSSFELLEGREMGDVVLAFWDSHLDSQNSSRAGKAEFDPALSQGPKSF